MNRNKGTTKTEP